jgi:hypothetical protein
MWKILKIEVEVGNCWRFF